MKTSRKIYAMIRKSELTPKMKRVLEVTNEHILTTLLTEFNTQTIYFPKSYPIVKLEKIDRLEVIIGNYETTKIAREFRGEALHIPRITKFRKFIKRYIRETNKTNREISIDLGVTEDFISRTKNNK